MTSTHGEGMETQAPTVSETEPLPEGAILVDPALLAAAFTYTYTTGPFALPANSQHIDWAILNNDTTPQTRAGYSIRLSHRHRETSYPSRTA
jgi:hypothetical protein